MDRGTMRIRADDFEQIEESITAIANESAAAKLEIVELKGEIARAFGLASYEWRKAPLPILASLEILERCLRRTEEESRWTYKQLLKLGSEEEADQ